MVTLRTDGILFSSGKNTHGQLGLSDLQPRDSFKCIEDLTNISKVFAGSRSCFAVAKSTSATQQMLDEFIAVNVNMQQSARVKWLKIQTSDNQHVLVHRAIWHVYFSQAESLSLPRKAAVYLLRMLYGELNNISTDIWLHKQLQSGYNVLEIRDTFLSISTWLSSGSD